MREGEKTVKAKAERETDSGVKKLRDFATSERGANALYRCIPLAGETYCIRRFAQRQKEDRKSHCSLSLITHCKTRSGHLSHA